MILHRFGWCVHLTRTLIPLHGPADPHRPNPTRNGIQTWSDRNTISDSGCRSERFFWSGPKGRIHSKRDAERIRPPHAHLVSLLPRAQSLLGFASYTLRSSWGRVRHISLSSKLCYLLGVRTLAALLSSKPSPELPTKSLHDRLCRRWRWLAPFFISTPFPMAFITEVFLFPLLPPLKYRGGEGVWEWWATNAGRDLMEEENIGMERRCCAPSHHFLFCSRPRSLEVSLSAPQLFYDLLDLSLLILFCFT